VTEATQRDKRQVLRHRYRTRAKDVPYLTAPEWLAIKAAYQNACAYCGASGPLTVDHIVPVSRGGDHCADNVVPACPACNSGKKDRMPVFAAIPIDSILPGYSDHKQKIVQLAQRRRLGYTEALRDTARRQESEIAFLRTELTALRATLQTAIQAVAEVSV